MVGLTQGAADQNLIRGDSVLQQKADVTEVTSTKIKDIKKDTFKKQEIFLINLTEVEVAYAIIKLSCFDHFFFWR